MAILKNNNSVSHSKDANTTGKVITCKAAVAWGPAQPLVVEEILVDPPQKMEVRIKILFTSICQTDLGVWLGKNEAQNVYPRIFGHEASGVVESVGEGVEDMKAGDHVVPIFNGECSDCVFCKSKTSNLCKKFRVDPLKSVMVNDGKTRFWTKQGEPIYHFLNTSTFSEYTVVDSANVVKIDRNAHLKTMTLLSCGVSTGLGAAWNTANVQEGSTVAVFGLGAVGLAVVEGARSRGASRIIGIDINSEKLSRGESMGVTDIINPLELHKPVHEEISEILEGGVDFSFECAGNLNVLREAFLSTHETLMEKLTREAAKVAMVKIVSRIVEGDAGKAICKEAEKVKPIAVVMGTRGRSLMQSVLQGSVSEYCFHNCKASPVIIVPGIVEAGEESVASLDKR